MAGGLAIALVDGEHHPGVVREALDRLDAERGLAGTVFCGGEEKVRAGVLEDAERFYGRPLELGDPVAALERLAAAGATAVVDLADEPVLPPAAKLRLAAHALSLGLVFESPGLVLRPPRYERVAFEGPKLAVIGTGKRTGKTAVACHWAALLRERGARPAIVSMGRGGPAEPRLARAGASLEDLLAVAASGDHAASDYLEDAAVAGVPAVGCRRVGGGLAGEAFASNVLEGARLAASLDPGTLIFEGSGATVPPVEVDATVCVAGDAEGALGGLGPYRLLRAQLVLAMGGDRALAQRVREVCRARVLTCELRPEPVEPLDGAARVALFTTGAPACDGADPVVYSPNLARRAALAGDVERAASERCDTWLVEVKAAGIDTVAERARREGARVIFVRNRPVALDGDLDEELVRLHGDA
ncbi:MAG: 2,3-diphosphoglycerate synthetase [Thermoleophilaceae bacterium]|nr:2,3-diphosphoglycerate synthetase [Thermoleophilaceae bacterium]